MKSKVFENKCISCDKQFQSKNRHSTGVDIDRIIRRTPYSAREILTDLGLSISPGKKQLCEPCTYITRNIKTSLTEFDSATQCLSAAIGESSGSYLKLVSPATPESSTPLWTPNKLRKGKRPPGTPTSSRLKTAPKRACFRTPVKEGNLKLPIPATPVNGTCSVRQVSLFEHFMGNISTHFK